MDRKIINRRYRLERKLGDGGTAEVYLGFDTVLNRPVALKLLRPQFATDRTYRLRFEREAQQAARLAHPNIVAIYDVGESQGTPYIVMEYVDGQPLSEIIANEAPFHPDDVAILVEQVAAALDFAHQRGLVHRDVKPQNVLVDRQGMAKVTDFGIAKGIADTALTDKGIALGTVHYISPEQASGLMATPESDLYSLAVIAFEMLTGELPFESENAIGIAMRHLNESPPDPRDLEPEIPTEMSDIVLRALSKNPSRRFRSAGEFAHALTNWRDYHPEDWRAARERATNAAGVRITQSFQALTTAVTPPAPYPQFAAPPTSSPTPSTPIAPAPPPPAPVLATTTTVHDDETRGFPWAGVILGFGLLIAALWFARPAWNRLNGDDPRPTATFSAVAGGSTSTPTPVPPTPTTAPTVIAIGVPDLTGQTRAAAQATAAALGLAANVTGEEPSDLVPAGSVVQQEPAPGSSVSEGDGISLVLSSGPAAIDGTDLAPPGSSGDQAVAALRAAGLNVMRAEAGSSTIPVGAVVRVEPAGPWHRGDTVTLYVSAGDMVQIPFALQGEPLSTVQSALTDLGFDASRAIGVPASTIAAAGIDVAANAIVDGDVVGVQDNGAAFGAWLPPGTEVTLVYYDASLDSASSGA